LSAQIADFQIKFTTESAQFNKDVEYAKKMLRGYTTEAVAANDENIGFAESLKESAAQAKLLGSGFVTVAGSVSAAMASVTAAAGYLITTQANQARELERMAVVSGETVESIQALGYASEQYGISGEKMSDILKDVNDKLGDYAQTGGGEFADFFDNILPKVGLTAEALQKMSGPDALVAVKNAMDEANVPMKDQIFYLESIANDASALMPLLENQGKKLYELKGHYDNLNVAMSEYDIEQFKQMDQQLTDASLKIERAFANAVVGSKDQIDWMTGYLVNAINYWGSLFDSWSDDPRTVDGLSKKLGELRSAAMPTRKELAYLESQLDNFDNKPGNQELWSVFKKQDLEKAIQSKRDQLKLLDNEIDQYQEKFGKLQFGTTDPNNGNTPPIPTGNGGSFKYPDKTKYDDSQLASLDMQLASETEKMKLAHEQRLADIESYNISAKEIEARGYDSLFDLKDEYKKREDDYYDTQVEDYNAKREDQLQKEFDQLQAAEEKKNQIAETAARKRAAVEGQIEKSVFQMKVNLASQTLGLIESSAKEGSTIQKAAFLAQKIMNAYLVIQQGQVASMAAMAPPPIGLGPIAGTGYAASITAMSYASAGLIMGQAIAGMAHDGIDSVPSEGTWLLNTGERVYTNDSVAKLDQMYSAVMSMYSQMYSGMASSNDATYATSAAASGYSASAIVNIFGAPEGTRVEQDRGQNGEDVTNVFLSDISSGGDMSSALELTYGLSRQGA
jgi:hypothetical protein